MNCIKHFDHFQRSISYMFFFQCSSTINEKKLKVNRFIARHLFDNKRPSKNHFNVLKTSVGEFLLKNMEKVCWIAKVLISTILLNCLTKYFFWFLCCQYMLSKWVRIRWMLGN